MSRGGWRGALTGRASAEGPVAEVSRVVLDVSLSDGRRGLVMVSLHDGVLVAVDDRGERGSELARAAVAWLDALVREGADRISGGEPLASRVSFPPTPSARLEDLALDLVRSGIAGARRGALDDPLRQARARADARSARWIARFEGALAADDVDVLGMLLRGALARPSSHVESGVDLRLVEVARERLDGLGPRRIERRYLVDLADGRVLVEEHDVAQAHGSLGPMPRLVEAGLVELQREPAVTLARILQYTTTPRIDAATLARLGELAETDVSRCLARVESDLSANPGWAEPVVLFSPERSAPKLALLDAAGHAVPFSREEDVSACLLLEEIAARTTPRWVTLRACPRRGAHAFVPLSCAIEKDGGTEIVRLRG